MDKKVYKVFWRTNNAGGMKQGNANGGKRGQTGKGGGVRALINTGPEIGKVLEGGSEMSRRPANGDTLTSGRMDKQQQHFTLEAPVAAAGVVFGCQTWQGCRETKFDRRYGAQGQRKV